MRFFSFLCSLLIHILLIYFIIFFTKSIPKINLDTSTSYKVEIITLKSQNIYNKKNKVLKKKDKTKKIIKKKVIKISVKKTKIKRKRPTKIDTKKIKENEIKRALYDIKKTVIEEESKEKIIEKEIKKLKKEEKIDNSVIDNTSEGEINTYKKIIEGNIQSHWRYVSKKTNTFVIIKITINERGEIIETKIIHSSGNKMLDNLALRAIEEAQRENEILPPPNKQKITFNITFGKGKK